MHAGGGGAAAEHLFVIWNSIRAPMQAGGGGGAGELVIV